MKKLVGRYNAWDHKVISISAPKAWAFSLVLIASFEQKAIRSLGDVHLDCGRQLYHLTGEISLER